MTKTKLIDALQKGIVNFTYTKVDGTIRHAHGTINADFIEDDDKSAYLQKLYDTKASDFLDKIMNNGYLTYYDVDKKEIRCFDPDSAKLA